MNFEKLKKSHLKRNIVIGIIAVFVISAIILNFARAKYRVTQSIPLVNGIINYSLADLNIVAIYTNSDSGYTEVETIPESGYMLNEEESYCKLNDVRDDSINLSYDTETKSLSVTPMTAKGTKCYLYFDEFITPKDFILSNYPTVLTRNDFTTTISETTTGTIYKSKDSSQYDDYGEVYYFAGNPTDNWVKFAEFYWRIIRINGDGTIRMIYQGASANTTGSKTQIGMSAFNDDYTNNMYVGYMYQSNQVHGLSSNSTIKGVLDSWYHSNLSSYASSIDGNAGFCGDRTPYTNTSGTTSGGGTGTTTTYYGGYIRLVSSKSPSFKCTNNSDLYTTSGSSDGNKALTNPIGLITADEVAFAGGVYNTGNANYYLCTSTYWTMSPYDFFLTGRAFVFAVISSGYFTNILVSDTYGVRPVINLKADVTISGGNGTADNPYTIS